MKKTTLIMFFGIFLLPNVVWAEETVCSIIKNLSAEKKLSNIILSNSESQDQRIDIDNDGYAEELKYFPTRKYMSLAEIRDDKRLTLPTGNPSALFSGSSIVRFDGKNYLLTFSSNGPYELIELIDPKAHEEPHHYRDYDVKTVCSFYEN